MTISPSPVLELTDVSAGYGRQLAIDSVSLEVQAGRRVGLIGPNGAGKSTLFSVALGTMTPWRGGVRLFGQDVRKLDRRRFPIAYVPQARRLSTDFPVTARDVVAMGRVGRLGLFRFPGTKDRTAVQSAIQAVGLASAADKPFRALSGGQQQRLLVARALASEARLLFFDEPATGVDVKTQRQLDDVLNGLVAEGCGVFISTHDLSHENLSQFDWLICLNREVLAQGPPETVTNLDLWRRLFGNPGLRSEDPDGSS